jgi:hypothetical protein
MPIIRISDPSRRARLLAHLLSQRDVIARPVNDDGVEINIVGSYNRAAHRELVLCRVRAWQAALETRGTEVIVSIE